MTRYKECKIIDDSNISRSITFDHFDIIEEGKTFKITNVTVTKYDNKKVLRVSENCSITKLEDSAIDARVPSGNDTNVPVSGIIAMVESKTLQPSYCCTKCDTEIKNSDGLFFCWGNAVLENEVLKKDQVFFTVRCNDSTKIHLSCAISVLEDFVGETSDISLFLKLFLGRKVKVVYKKQTGCNEVVNISDTEDSKSGNTVEDSKKLSQE